MDPKKNSNAPPVQDDRASIASSSSSRRDFMNDRVNAKKAYLAKSQRIDAEKRKLALDRKRREMEIETELAERAAELEREALEAQAVRDLALAQIDDEEDEVRQPDSREDTISVTSKIRQWNSDGQQPSPPDSPGMMRRVSDNTQDGKRSWVTDIIQIGVKDCTCTPMHKMHFR